MAGRLVALDGKRLTIETAAGRASWALAKLMGISAKQKPPAPAATGGWIDLVDGSALLARQFTAHNGRAQIVPRGGAADRVARARRGRRPLPAAARRPPASGRGC